MTFLQKLYGDYNNIEKPVLVTTIYERSIDEEELKLVPILSQSINHYNVVNDSNSESGNKSEGNLFDKDINETVKAPSKITINAKVVHAVMKL